LNKKAETKKDPLIIVVSSPSGGGKTTIVNKLFKEIEGIKRSVSYTTRRPRSEEKDREDYIFISGEEFKKKIEKNEFLEWEEVFGCHYGTSSEQVKEALSSGKDIVLCIDVKGAKRVKKKFPGSVSVFIMPPSRETLTTRLEKRHTEKKEQLNMRLKEAEKEIGSADEYDYMIVNDDLDEAVRELKSIIEMERENRRLRLKK